jgi:hypothetical protein
MLKAFLVLAAEEGAEPSKTAFYILGGALAAYAVVLSAIGLTRPSFPAGPAAAKGVMALTTAMVAAAIVAVFLTS